VEEKGLVSQIPADADMWVAKVLAQQATAAALIAGVVTPVLAGVGAVMKVEGKRIAIALGKQISKEMKPVQEAVTEQGKLLKKLTKMMRKLDTAPQSNKRDRRSGSPAATRAANAAPSARKVKRSEPVQPSSSKKPGKRERSDSDGDSSKLKQYAELVTKIKAAEGGEAMLDGFMGKDFAKKHRAESDEDMQSEESDDEEDEDEEDESSDSE
jgi:hypothetical protein